MADRHVTELFKIRAVTESTSQCNNPIRSGQTRSKNARQKYHLNVLMSISKEDTQILKTNITRGK